MLDRAHSFLGSKWLYPVALLALIGSMVGVARCPALHPMASDFSLPLVTPDGRTGTQRMRLQDQRGKVVVLDFWATWCGPCQATTPALVRLSHRFRDRGLVVLGINVDQEGPAIVPAFARRFGLDYPVVYDDGQVMDRYGVRGLPTMVVIDRSGRIHQVHVGAASERELADQIEGLL